MDRYTHWVEAVTLRSMTTALVEGWVSRSGVPQQITSDKGSQFTLLVWVVFTRWLGIKMQLTTPYLPQANGTMERFHRWLKDSLRARLAVSDWLHHLP